MSAPTFCFTLTFFENGDEGPFQQDARNCALLSQEAAVAKTASYPEL